MTKNRKQKTFGEEIIEGLSEFRDALKSGKPLEEQFTMRTVRVDLNPRAYSPQAIRETREKLGASQAVFAELLGVSVPTVQKWEQGKRNPPKMARRLLDEVNMRKGYWIELLKGARLRRTSHKATA